MKSILSDLYGYWGFNGEQIGSLNGLKNLTDSTSDAAITSGIVGLSTNIDAQTEGFERTFESSMPPTSSNAPYTITAWIYQLSTQVSSQRVIIRNFESNVGAHDRCWEIYFRGTDAVLWFTLYTANDTSSNNVGHTIQSTEVLALNRWYFFAAWQDGSSQSIRVNNTVNTATYTGTHFQATPELTIGHNNGPGDSMMRWRGYMDEIGIWNRVLSGAEIEYLYNNGMGRSLHPWTDNISIGDTGRRRSRMKRFIL